MRKWRARAQASVEPALREDALFVLERKRTHVDGAAMFATLLPGRKRRLRRLLVAYEMALDFLDYTSERGQTSEPDPAAGEANGRQLHAALLNALDARTPLAPHYALHLWSDDAGYLRALVIACREGTNSLPSYSLAQTLATEEAERAAEVLAVNHIPDAQLRNEGLQKWAERRFPDEQELRWFEVSAAVSGSLAIHGLLAAAAEPEASAESVCVAHTAYLRWVGLATAMLDSHADRLEDERAGGHSYVAHYGDVERRRAALRALVKETLEVVGRLSCGRRHVVLSACMMAMYLSKDDACSPALAPETWEIVDAGGRLVRCLLPALRAWRVFFAHQSA
jgi:hypothetical protein